MGVEGGGADGVERRENDNVLTMLSIRIRAIISVCVCRFLCLDPHRAERSASEIDVFVCVGNAIPEEKWQSGDRDQIVYIN